MADLFDALEQDYVSNGRRSVATLKFRLAPLRDAFGPDRAVEVRAARIAEYRTARLAEGLAPATVNRELAALRRAFRLAVEQERIATAPTVKLLAEHNVRQGFVNPGDFEAVVDALRPDLKDCAFFGYLVGWRRGAIRTLEWGDIDRAAERITLRWQHSKNEKPVPISYAGVPGLAGLIERRWQAREYTTPAGPALARFVFHRGGHQIKDFRAAWETACKAAGMPDLLFHDLRRSAVRNLIDAGVDEGTAMKITGHRTRTVFDRYRIVDERNISAALAKTEAATKAAQMRTVVPLRAAEGKSAP